METNCSDKNKGLPRRVLQYPIVECGAEGLVHLAESKRVAALNKTARLILELCDGETPSSQIVEAIMSRFAGLDTGRVASDVQETLIALEQEGLIQWE